MIVADAALAVAVERLERDDGGARGHAAAGAVAVVAVAGDDAGHVRAVAPVVVGGRATVPTKSTNLVMRWAVELA